MATRWAGLTLSCALAALPVMAQTDESSSDTTVYTPADFARFSPRTALDMVRELPGFQIEGSDGGRGLGQASGNVLLNGERISGKSTDTLDVLDRIPVDRVVRVELVDAAAFGIPGLSGRVANVISTSGEVSGVWEYEGRLRERLEPRLNQGEVSVSGNRGNLEWTVGLEANANRFGAKGPETVTDGDGTLIESRNLDSEGQFEYVEGSLGLNWSPPSGHEANFNASYAVFNNVRRVRDRRTGPSLPDTYRVFNRGEDEWNSEISGDYALPLFGGTFKLIGLHRHEDSRFDARVVNRELADFVFRDGIKLDDDFIENEAILRGEFDWRPREGEDWQIAVESAYNRLDAGSSFFTLDSALALNLENLATPTLVEENRYEVSLTHSRPFGSKLSLQASLSGDFSEISSEVGTSVQSQDFVRPKGYLAATYDVSDLWDVNLRIEREVGQLSFFDFVASQDLNTGVDDAANRDLVPDQTWRFEAEFDRSFGDTGGLELTFFHEEIEDLIDRIPIGTSGADGPGNIESATRTGIDASLTYDLDGFGLEGVQLEWAAEWETSEVEDPVTGRMRPISRNEVSFMFAELRWDIPNTDYAVLLAGEQGRSERNFRIDETSRYTQTEPFAWIEFEHKDFFGTNAFVRFGNLFDSTDAEERVVYAPDRTGEIIEIYDFEGDFGYILTFGISGSF